MGIAWIIRSIYSNHKMFLRNMGIAWIIRSIYKRIVIASHEKIDFRHLDDYVP
jgi:hypothetical protein